MYTKEQPMTILIIITIALVIVATLVEVARDGYRRVPAQQAR